MFLAASLAGVKEQHRWKRELKWRGLEWVLSPPVLFSFAFGQFWRSCPDSPNISNVAVGSFGTPAAPDEWVQLASKWSGLQWVWEVEEYYCWLHFLPSQFA